MMEPGVAALRLTRQDVLTNVNRDDFPRIVEALRILLDRIEQFEPHEREILAWWIDSSERFVRMNLRTHPGTSVPALQLAA